MLHTLGERGASWSLPGSDFRVDRGGSSGSEVLDLALVCCRWFLFQSCRLPFDMVSQSAGQFGFRSLLGRGSSTAWSDTEPWPMDGRLGVEVAWSVGLGECRGLGVARP